MTWVVIVYSSSYPKRVIGPMSKETAEALAAGISMMRSGTGGESAAALPLEAP